MDILINKGANDVMWRVANVYCLQQGIIFLMWAGLLKMLWNELRALRRENVSTEGVPASGEELRKCWDRRIKSIDGRKVAINGSRGVSEGRQRLRIRSAENWNGVGVS